jgi:PAS domain S-box-containing protein
VICTAYSDYSWDEMLETLGTSDRLLILKKPFDNIEALQLANALSEKWHLARQAQGQMEELELHVRERTEELQRSNISKGALLAAISSILIGVDEQGKVIEWNHTAEATFSKRCSEVVGHSFDECGIQWDWTSLVRKISRCLDQGHATRLDDIRYLRPDGKEGFLGITVSPIRSESGKSNGYLLLGTDITEHKLLQAQLGQAQKLESIGQLAAGIAHEINTPTQYVGDNCRFLQEAFKDVAGIVDKYRELLAACQTSNVTRERLSSIELAAKTVDLEYLIGEIPNAIQQALDGNQRVAKIVQSMKEFAHPGTSDKSAADLNRAIETTLNVTRNEWKYVAELDLDLDPELPLVPVFLDEFNQVILNMVVNATHAIMAALGPDGESKGRITIRTCHSKEFAEVQITDTGTGIPPTVLPRIFDPFFTTKEVGKGTGQGLAISHSVVVKKHGGSIHVETGVGKGTTFIVRLPLEASSTAA